MKNKETFEKAVFAAGCFWGVEEVFNKLDGVIDTLVGYTGGEKKDPTYEQVCANSTGHAEAVEITFDPKKITYHDLLNKFWQIHDPTTLNRQGPDVGSQYRSAIFYTNLHQKEMAEKSKHKMQKTGLCQGEIVTEISPLDVFYPAESYHQKYFLKHPGQGCSI